MPAARPVMVRLLEKIRYTPDCWEWTAKKSIHGYGQIGVNRKVLYAHRVLYELVVGPVPEGCELDHLCRNRGCVRPSHLEPVTHQENMRRSPEHGKANRRKTHCPRGHPYDEENTFWTTRGGRKCRRCILDLARQRQGWQGHEGKSAYQLSRTHCPHGHPYDEENTLITKSGSRRCRACNRDRLRALYAKRRSAKREATGVA